MKLQKFKETKITKFEEGQAYICKDSRVLVYLGRVGVANDFTRKLEANDGSSCFLYIGCIPLINVDGDYAAWDIESFEITLDRRLNMILSSPMLQKFVLFYATKPNAIAKFGDFSNIQTHPDVIKLLDKLELGGKEAVLEPGRFYMWGNRSHWYLGHRKVRLNGKVKTSHVFLDCSNILYHQGDYHDLYRSLLNTGTGWFILSKRKTIILGDGYVEVPNDEIIELGHNRPHQERKAYCYDKTGIRYT